jgi:hypothetical protein
MTSCSASRAIILVDDSFPDPFLVGRYEKVLKVRDIVFEVDKDESG